MRYIGFWAHVSFKYSGRLDFEIDDPRLSTFPKKKKKKKLEGIERK